MRLKTFAAASVVAGLGAAGFAALPADASATFLRTSDLPSASQDTPWTAHGVKSGLPKPMYTCIKGILPKSRSEYQTYGGDLTAEVREIVTVTPRKKDAKTLVRSLRDAITHCEDKLSDITGVDRVGRWSTEDGLTLDAVYSAPPDSEYSFQLFAVGRDGRSVVVTTFSDMGQKGDAPTAAFTATAKRGLQKLF